MRLGTDTEIKIDLEVGTPTETVTVTGNTEEVVQTTSQISASFETRKVEELPSNAAGGGLDTIALLAPGVVPTLTGYHDKRQMELSSRRVQFGIRLIF